MPNSAAYRRPRSANSSGNRNVIAIECSLPRWYHYDTADQRPPINLRVHRYTTRLGSPVSKRCLSSMRAPVCAYVKCGGPQCSENELLGLFASPRFDSSLQRA
jgi:hypothetical protein